MRWNCSILYAVSQTQQGSGKMKYGILLAMGLTAATALVGEDEEHVHVFSRIVDDVHSKDFVLVAEATPASQIAIYALPDTSTVVSASAMHKVDKRGKHTVTNTYVNCKCGVPHIPRITVSTYDVEPDHYEWTATGPGLTLESSTWTGPKNGIGVGWCQNPL